MIQWEKVSILGGYSCHKITVLISLWTFIACRTALCLSHIYTLCQIQLNIQKEEKMQYVYSQVSEAREHYLHHPLDAQQTTPTTSSVKGQLQVNKPASCSVCVCCLLVCVCVCL